MWRVLPNIEDLKDIPRFGGLNEYNGFIHVWFVAHSLSVCNIFAIYIFSDFGDYSFCTTEWEAAVLDIDMD